MFSHCRKMNILMLAYTALLFVVLTPGVLLRLPMKGSKMTVALTHGAIFAVVWYFTHKMVSSGPYEGFQGVMKPGKTATNVAGRVVNTSPAQARVDAAQNTLNNIQERYNQAAQVATDIENQLLNAQRNLQSAQQELRVAQGLPQDGPIRKATR